MPRQPEPFILKLRGSSPFFYYKLAEWTAYKTTGCKTKVDAMKVVQKAIEFENKMHLEDTFRHYADPYFQWDTCPRIMRRLAEGKSIGETHVKKSRAWLEKHIFLDDTFCELKMSDIRRADVLDLRQRLIAMGTGTNTINKCIATVKTIMSEAYFREEIERDPGSRIGSLNYEKKEKGILTKGELGGLFSEIPGPFTNLRAYCVFNLAAKTGMRCGEVLALTWDAIDFAGEIIDVREAWKTHYIKGLPKSNRKRQIPVVPGIMASLERLNEESIRIATTDLIFCYEDGTRLGPTWWRKSFQRALKKAKITKNDVTPHSLRHSLNSHLLAAGCDPVKVRAYMGWTDNVRAPVLTPVQAGYTHWPADHLKDLLPPINEIFAPN